MSNFELEPVDSDVCYTLEEVCQRCNLNHTTILEWVEFGIANPQGSHGEDYRFGPSQLSRIHRARRLQRDLEINAAGLALALDLLDVIKRQQGDLESLKRQLGL